MDAEIKKRWVDALRSGKYKQGRGALRSRDDSFCCLGVLCDVIAPNLWEDNGEVYAHIGATAMPIDAILNDGLKIRVGDESFAYLLARENDEGATFEEIAELIEENL